MAIRKQQCNVMLFHGMSTDFMQLFTPELELEKHGKLASVEELMYVGHSIVKTNDQLVFYLRYLLVCLVQFIINWACRPHAFSLLSYFVKAYGPIFFLEGRKNYIQYVRFPLA